MSATSGPVKLYFDMFGGKDRIEIHQGTTANFTTSTATRVVSTENCVTLTASDRTSLDASGWRPGGAQRRAATWGGVNGPSARPDFTRLNRGTVTNYWVTNVGKIEFTHNPVRGLYYKVVFVKGSPAGSFRICYPIDQATATATTTTVSSTVPQTVAAQTPSIYRGHFVGATPSSFSLQQLVNRRTDLVTHNQIQSTPNNRPTNNRPTNNRPGR